MTKSNNENHRGSCPPLLVRTGKLLGSIYCDLTEEKNENRFVRTVPSNFPSFMWISKKFNTVNEITYCHAITLMHLSGAQILNFKEETPTIVSLHCPLNTPKKQLLTPQFWSF